MKKIIFIASLLIYQLFLLGCNDKKESNLIEIDMNANSAISFDKLVMDISCIKLDSTFTSSFNSCKRVIKYKDFIYLLTEKNAINEIFIYQSSGEFIKKISFGSDILFINSLIIEPFSEELWAISNLNVINKYKLDGTFINKTSLSFPCVDVITTDTKEYLVYDGDFNKKQACSISLTDLVSQSKLFIHKLNRSKSQYIPQSLFAGDSNIGNIFILPRLNDTVYHYDPIAKQVKPYFHLNFHGDLLTENTIPQEGYSDKEMHNIINNRQYIYTINSIYLASNKLFFKMTGKRNDFCAIDINEHSISCFSLLFDNFLSTANNPFVGADEKHLYCIVNSKDLYDHYQKHPCNYEEIKNLLSTSNSNDNRIILLQIEIK